MSPEHISSQCSIWGPNDAPKVHMLAMLLHPRVPIAMRVEARFALPILISVEHLESSSP